MKKREITLGQMLDVLAMVDVDVDLEVDGCGVIAYCGTRMTEEGEKRFAEALDLPVEGLCIVSHDDEDYDLADLKKGKLYLAWQLLVSMAGYCACDDYDKWFE